MIEFITDHDEATRANRIVYGPTADAALLGPDASRPRLTALLGARSDPVVALSHGDHRGPMDQAGEPAFDATTLATAPARPVWVWACHTGTRFGQQAAQNGWTWWGYTGAVSAPGAGEDELPILRGAFAVAVAAFKRGGSPAAAEEAVVALEVAVRRIQEALDELGGGASQESYLFLLHLWDRLRVWFPGAGAHVNHPRASKPLLFP